MGCGSSSSTTTRLSASRLMRTALEAGNPVYRAMAMITARARWRIRRIRIACLVATLCAAVGAVPQAHAAPAPKYNPPKSVYLALGDSLAFGYQQAKFNANFPAEDPDVYDTGYVDDFAAELRSIDSRIRTVNLACPGETTDSLLGREPCIYHPPFRLHSGYSGSQ